MRRMRYAATAAFALWAGAVLAEPVELGPGELRKLAYDVLTAGNAEQALALTDALMQRDPKDAQTLILRSQILQSLGREAEARAAARAAYRASGTGETRYGSAMVMAQLLSEADRPTMTQLWLRRAAQAAPNDQAKAVARQDFQHVRSGNPWIFQFDLSLSPSSNVNNGSANTSFVFEGLPQFGPYTLPIEGESRALSGAEASFGATAIYRLVPTETGMTQLHFSAEQRVVWLSDKAKTIAPTARARDYAFSSLEMGIGHKYRPLNSEVIYDFDATLGHNWYGGYDMSNYLQLQASADRRLGARTAGMIGISAEHQDRVDNPDRTASIYGLTLGLARGLENRDRLQFTVAGRWTETDNPGIRNDALIARVGWSKSEPVAGIGVSAGLALELRDYPESPYKPGEGRLDQRVTLDMSLEFQDVEYMGFTPTLDLRASRNTSNVGLFESEDFGVNIGIKSAF